MLNISGYAAAALALFLALEYVAPADASLAYRDASHAVTAYQVDRAAKSDRLMPSKSQKENAARSNKILVGCDPAFSNLSANARMNFAARCIS